MKKLILGSIFILGTGTVAFSQVENSSILKQKMDSLFQDVKILPNPTSEIIFIRNGENITSYQLFNMQGQKVQESKNNIQIVSLIDEKIGHYFLILEIDGIQKSYRIQKY